MFQTSYGSRGKTAHSGVSPASLLGFAVTQTRGGEKNPRLDTCPQWKKEEHTWRAAQTKGKTVIGEETASNLLLVCKVNLFLEERDTVTAH